MVRRVPQSFSWASPLLFFFFPSRYANSCYVHTTKLCLNLAQPPGASTGQAKSLLHGLKFVYYRRSPPSIFVQSIQNIETNPTQLIVAIATNTSNKLCGRESVRFCAARAPLRPKKTHICRRRNDGGKEGGWDDVAEFRDTRVDDARHVEAWDFEDSREELTLVDRFRRRHPYAVRFVSWRVGRE